MEALFLRLHAAGLNRFHSCFRNAALNLIMGIKRAANAIGVRGSRSALHVAVSC
jgi:hypothetical protein